MLQSSRSWLRSALTPPALVPGSSTSRSSPRLKPLLLDDDDFEDRLKRLDIFELRYLTEVILDGSESLGCVQPEHAEILARLLSERVSEDVGRKVMALYEAAGECRY